MIQHNESLYFIQRLFERIALDIQDPSHAYRKEISKVANNIKSIARRLPEMITYGGLLDTILFMYSKSGNNCLCRIAEKLMKFQHSGAINYEEILSQCSSRESIAYSILLSYTIARVNEEMKTFSSDIGSALQRISSNSLEADVVTQLVVSNLVKVKRLAEAYFKDLGDSE